MTGCHHIRTIIKNMQTHRKKLQQITGKVVRKLRTKSITKSADETGMGKSLWADLENGIKDPQFSTLRRVAEDLEIKPHVLVKMIEDEIGEDFSFLEDGV